VSGPVVALAAVAEAVVASLHSGHALLKMLGSTLTCDKKRP